MLIFTLLAAGSTSTRPPRMPQFLLHETLERMSSCSHFAKSFSEYHCNSSRDDAETEASGLSSDAMRLLCATSTTTVHVVRFGG